MLKQGRNSPVRVGCQVAIVYAVINGYLDKVDVDKVKDYEQALFDRLEARHTDWLGRIESGSWDDEDIDELKALLPEVKV